MKNNPKKAGDQMKPFSDCPDYGKLEDYTHFHMTTQEEVELEKYLQNCKQDPCLCQDLLQGMELARNYQNLEESEPELFEDYNPARMRAKINSALQQNRATQSKKVVAYRVLKYALPMVATLLLAIVFWLGQDVLISVLNSNTQATESSFDESNSGSEEANKNSTITHQKPPSDTPAASVPETQADIRETLAIYQPNPQLEAKIYTRAEVNTRGISQGTPRVISHLPKNKSKFEVGSIVEFSWKLDQAVEELEFILLDREENTVLERFVSLDEQHQGSIQIDTQALKLKSGLYYWQLLGEIHIHTSSFQL